MVFGRIGIDIHTDIELDMTFGVGIDTRDSEVF